MYETLKLVDIIYIELDISPALFSPIVIVKYL